MDRKFTKILMTSRADHSTGWFKSLWTLFLIEINDSLRNQILIKVFQFYVHCFLWPLLKHQYPECSPLFCITFLSRCGMERASSLRLASGMLRQAFRNLDFSPPIVLGIGSLYAALSMMFHRLSMGFKVRWICWSLIFLDKIREVSLAPLLCCFRRMSWCAILNEGRTAFVLQALLL